MATRRPPARRQDTEVRGSEDPPPAYEATPTVQTGEQTLEYGPTRPFQPPPPPIHHSQQQQQQHQPQFSPPSSSQLPPPSFPFWNGPNLTAQQTGFNPTLGPQGDPYYQQQHPYPSFQHPNGPPPQQLQPPSHPPIQHSSSHGPPPSHPSSNSSALRPPSSPPYAPTTVATPGQALMSKGRLLVYPVGFECPKCGNTGYKSNDPSHPCRKCWEKYGRPFSPALLFAPGAPSSSTTSSISSNLQRPLRAFARPQQSQSSNTYPGCYPNSMGPTIMSSRVGPPPGAVVVLPGDPRIGGTLCHYCGGRGLKESMFSFFDSEETCGVCRGSGRVF